MCPHVLFQKRFILCNQRNLQKNLISCKRCCIMIMYAYNYESKDSGMEKMLQRVSKHNYYLDIAQTVAERSTCLRKMYGAIIVKDDVIVSTGYNGAHRGRKNSSDLQYCMRDKLNIPRGERYELCRSVHAEANAIITAARERMLGATLYMVCVDPQDGSLVSGTSSCMMCKRMIINAGISTVVVRDTEKDFRMICVEDWIENDDSLSGTFGY